MQNLTSTSLLFILYLLFCSCEQENFSTAEPTVFIKFFGSFDNDAGVKVAELPQKGYLILGTTGVSNVLPGESITSNSKLIFTNYFGDTVWEYEVNEEGHARAGSIIIGNNNEIFISGTISETTESRFTDIFIAQISEQGEQEWISYFGQDGISESAIEMSYSSDGGLVIIGNSYTLNDDISSNSNQDFYVLKADISGNTIWERTYGFEEGKTDYGNALVENANGEFIWVGSTEKDNLDSPGFNSDMRVVKSNNLGNLVWDYLFGGEGNDYGNKVITQFNNYLLAGSKQSGTNGNSNFYLVKIDDNGNELWHKEYGGDGNENAYDIYNTQDGGIIMAGYTFSYGNGSSDIFLVKTDFDGNEQWNSTIGGQGDDEAKSIIQTSDGGFLVAGTIQFENNTMICLIKTDENGKTSPL